MRKTFLIILTIVLIVVSVGCSKPSNKNEINISESTYEEILEQAKGTTVTFYGYGGNEVMNKWFDTYVIPQIKDKYDIKVKRVGMNIDDILNKLISEKQAGSTNGTIDVVWINGENFKIAKDNELLFGPFLDKLPNYESYVDKESKSINIDFGTPIDGMEAPWGKSQFTLIYNGSSINKIINDTETLKEVIKSNPGKFTYPAPPDFEGSAFVRNVIYDIVRYENLVNLNDEDQIREATKPAMDYLNEIKPYLWNKGETYPQTIAQLDNMYSDNEVYFTMTYAPNTIKGKMESGEFSKDSKIITFDKGNLSNTHFLAIPNSAQNKAGSIVLINFLMSIDAQGSKTNSQNWGDITVLDMNKIPDGEKSKFNDGVNIEETVPELNAKLVPIIEKIWTEEVLKNEK